MNLLKLLGTVLAILSLNRAILAATPSPAQADPEAWVLARKHAAVHRFSTLFTAQNVRDLLATDPAIDGAIQWCQQTAVTHVYLESFRGGYQVERQALEHARQRFRDAGFLVSGCITTTRVGKPSTGWKGEISCYTDLPTQKRLQEVFEFASALFDEIMIDDFWFTDCACAECDTARQSQTVSLGDHRYSVAGQTWEDYRCELMVRLSRERILEPARRINPRVKIIIKYPQWYDRFPERGYEVIRETADFDRIWVGTETRDYEDPRWGGTVPYEAYFIMRWLGGLGGAKCGGGWYDWLGTTEATYLEQARQTVLAGARESLLFCYGGLQRDTGPKNIAALRGCLPELFATAQAVAQRQAIGIAAYKPANSHPETEARVFDFVGMLGLPLLPCHQFPSNAPAAFFSIHAWKDPDLTAKLSAFIASGKPVLLTDALAERLGNRIGREAANVRILPVKGDPKLLLRLSPDELDAIRVPLLKPLGVTFRAPNQVGLYLFQDGSWVVENFNQVPVEATLREQAISLPARGWKFEWRP